MTRSTVTYVRGEARGSGGTEVPSGVQGQTIGTGSGDEVPRKLKRFS